MKLTTLLIAGALTCTGTLSFAQGSGGEGEVVLVLRAEQPALATRLRDPGRAVGTVNGTGGSPGPNTSNALNHGTTGNRIPSSAATNGSNGSSSPASRYANDRTMNKAVQDLGNTNNGILGPQH